MVPHSSSSCELNRAMAKQGQRTPVRGGARLQLWAAVQPGYRAARRRVTCVGMAAVLFVMYSPPPSTTRTGVAAQGNWTLSHVIYMALSGMFGGITLAAGAWIRHRSGELYPPPLQAVPMGALLALFGAVSALASSST